MDDLRELLLALDAERRALRDSTFDTLPPTWEAFQYAAGRDRQIGETMAQIRAQLKTGDDDEI